MAHLGSVKYIHMYSRLWNKQRGKLINYWTFFQRPCSLLKRVMHFFFEISAKDLFIKKSNPNNSNFITVLVRFFMNKSLFDSMGDAYFKGYA